MPEPIAATQSGSALLVLDAADRHQSVVLLNACLGLPEVVRASAADDAHDQRLRDFAGRRYIAEVIAVTPSMLRQ